MNKEVNPQQDFNGINRARNDAAAARMEQDLENLRLRPLADVPQTEQSKFNGLYREEMELRALILKRLRVCDPCPVSYWDRNNVGISMLNGTHFSGQLFRIIAKSDHAHKEQLRIAFPSHVEAFEAWQAKGGANNGGV